MMAIHGVVLATFCTEQSFVSLSTFTLRRVGLVFTRSQTSLLVEAQVDVLGRRTRSPVARLGPYFITPEAKGILWTSFAASGSVRRFQEEESSWTHPALPFRKELFSIFAKPERHVNEYFDSFLKNRLNSGKREIDDGTVECNLVLSSWFANEDDVFDLDDSILPRVVIEIPKKRRLRGFAFSLDSTGSGVHYIAVCSGYNLVVLVDNSSVHHRELGATSELIQLCPLYELNCMIGGKYLIKWFSLFFRNKHNFNSIRPNVRGVDCRLIFLK